MGGLNLLIHFLIFAVYLFSLSYNLLNIKIASNYTYGGRFKFLTFWNTCLQTFYFGFCLLHDLVDRHQTGPHDVQSKRSKLQQLRDLILASVIFPIGLFVVLTFWGIYAVDRELVFPKALDKFIPSWLNHTMHTTVIVFLVIDKYFVYHHYPSRKRGMAYMLGFAAIYQIWILWIAYYADIWVYPILQVLSVPNRVVFFAVLWVVLIGIYLIGEATTKTFWSSASRKASPVKKKIKKLK